jgi:hypothetical protein
MTKKIDKDLQKKARQIGDKAVSEDYIEDGGYIKDWLVQDIAQTLQEVRDTGVDKKYLLSIQEQWMRNKVELEKERSLSQILENGLKRCCEELKFVLAQYEKKE